ncbi:membrane cofactor protein-like [Ciona intestinalis]
MDTGSNQMFISLQLFVKVLVPINLILDLSHVRVRISCPPAYYLLNGTISGSSVDAGAQKTITCDIGFWINKETKLSEETITCDMKKGIWMRPDVACIETLCDDPGDLVGAHRYREPASLKYKEKMVYRCNEGYEYVVNKTTKSEFLTTCGSDGVWEPDLNHIECKRIECNFTVEHYDHGDILHSSNGTFYYGDQVKLECIHGYWVYLDKGIKSINFTCSETQLFYPNPLYVKCSGLYNSSCISCKLDYSVMSFFHNHTLVFIAT